MDHCRLLTNNATPAVKCTYVDGESACSARLCSEVTDNENNCYNWLPTCRWNGMICVDANTCSNYTAIGADDAAKDTFCKAMRNNSFPSQYCTFVFGSNTCTDRTCENAPTPGTDTDCSIYLTGCTITYTSVPACIATTSLCTDFTGRPNQC